MPLPIYCQAVLLASGPAAIINASLLVLLLASAHISAIKVTISNCIFDGTDRGIRLKSTRGRGGVVEDIRVSNIVMRNIKQEAVVLNLKYSGMPAEPKSERTPLFSNIHISGMTVTDVKTPVKIVGLEEAPISDIVLRDIHVQGAGEECVFEDCERITMEDVMVNGKKMYPKEVDEK